MVNSGNYTIRNLNSGLYIAESDGNAVQSAAEEWIFTLLDDGTYTVQASDGRALTVENGSAANGANMLLSDYTGDSSQKFILQCNKDGSYTLLSSVSGGMGCADVYGISLNDGANICQWEYWGGSSQKFILEPVADEEVIGDVNADGVFNVVDVVMMQNWILRVGDITDRSAGDVCEDGEVDIFDLCLMKKMLLSQL